VEEGNNRKRNREESQENNFSHLSTTQVIRSFIDHQTTLPPKSPIQKRKRHKPKSISLNNLQYPKPKELSNSDIPIKTHPPENDSQPLPNKTTTVHPENQTIRVMKIPWLID